MQTESSFGYHNSSPGIPLLSQVNPILVSYFLKTHSDTVLPHTTEFSKWSLLFTFPHQNLVRISSPPLALNAHTHNSSWSIQNMKLLMMHVSPAACYFQHFRPKHLLQHSILETINRYSSCNVKEQVAPATK